MCTEVGHQDIQSAVNGSIYLFILASWECQWDCTGTEHVITNDTTVHSELARTGKETATDRIYVLSRVRVEGLRKFTKSWDIMVGLQADINIILTDSHLYDKPSYTFITVFSRILLSFTNMFQSLLWPSSGRFTTNTVTCWWRIVMCYWTYL